MGIFIQGILIQRVLSTQGVLPKMTGKCFFIFILFVPSEQLLDLLGR
jgi:hypothetical protein